MEGIEIINKYFGHELTPTQKSQFEDLYELYKDWNSKINVISRKDFDSLYLKHVLHSLAIAKVCRFDNGARILDVGTGGGFPAIPLAIMFPEAHFTAVDSIGKKITVLDGVAQSLGLTNIDARKCRAEELPHKYHYVVSRAVTEMSTLMGWVWNKIERGKTGTLNNGIIVLKGGELAEELAIAGKKFNLYEISSFFDEEFFTTKKIIYLAK